MPLSLAARLEMIGPLSDEHRGALAATLAEWAERGERVTAFGRARIAADVSPITAFVSSESRPTASR
ncbi:conserved hypothetical protein [uncultured Pleomorphomonas sp.]|uniref:Uncharacterized protein n=2 Tax=Pleomorphomonas TaxID=261933 RepID=A0A2G9WZC7_9HYPH|nr:hypothetical protein [Pleomorphomonas carboxyditropha]PIP00077.1 hypothetical protein CJ014_04855 [Pleomorphomonas carboxyditropha]SCM76354.1 conserved hypothetical protein [uncultured Pleomorphomonas sp.]